MYIKFTGKEVIDTIYTLENDVLSVKVNSLGCELWSIFDKRDNTEHLWQGDESVWPRRAPNLFPLCGKLKEGKTVINGQEYSIPLHGFLRDFEHKLISSSESTLRFHFESNEETLKMFPYEFSVDTIFTLDNNKLVQSFLVENNSNSVMPFSIGYHTGYMCPFDKNHSISDYELLFERNETIDKFETVDNIITGKTKLLNQQDRIELCDNFFNENNPNIAFSGFTSEWLKIREKSTNRAVKIQIKGFPAVVLWSVPEKMPFLCVEPWYGMFDTKDDYGEFKNKPFVEHLQKNKIFLCSLSVWLEK